MLLLALERSPSFDLNFDLKVKLHTLENGCEDRPFNEESFGTTFVAIRLLL